MNAHGNDSGAGASQVTLVKSDPSRASFLEAVPIFAGLSKELQAEIADRSNWVQVSAGDWLFRQGDPGDSLYVVRSGRLEIVAEEPEPTIVRVLARGAVVGELALLTGSMRSASVRARRDSELLTLPRERFAELLRDHSDFALALTRELGRQLQASRALQADEQVLPSTITLVPLQHGFPLDDIRDRLLLGLRSRGVARCLDAGDAGGEPSRYAALLDEAERKHDQVLLIARMPEGGDDWTNFCLRQSDRIVALAAGDAPSWLEGHAELKGCDLLVRREGTQPAEVTAWLTGLQPRLARVLDGASRFDAGVDSLARGLAGRSVGVVLSGGGARGFTHIGVLQELLAAGLEIDRVGGCSMGAFVGALAAMGCEPDEIRERCHEEFVERNPLGDYTVPLVSVMRGQRAREMLTRMFDVKTIEELSLQYYSVSCDLLSGDLVVHRRGALFEAVGASMCLPGIFAPLRSDGRLLVDGGVLSNLPVEPMATGEGPVIAVDVTAPFLAPETRLPRRGRPRITQWATRTRRAVVGADEPLPNLKETLTRSIGLGSVDVLETARRQADVLITPDTGEVALLGFRQLDRMIEIGRDAARRALEAAPELLRS